MQILFKYLGLWIDEELNMKKATRELSKSASRALGAFCTKFKLVGGMNHTVFHKLYQSLVEPILFYCSGIWGTKSYSCINTVQNKAIKFFLGVGRNTSNLATRGDLGWSSCFTKQKDECIRLFCKLFRLAQDRHLFLLTKYLSQSTRKSSWYKNVFKIVTSINANELVLKLSCPVKFIVKECMLKLVKIDSDNSKKRCIQ